MKTKSKVAAYFDPPAMNQHAIASQFKEFRTEVADAIREKKGTTEPINPKDFAEEISTISGGGEEWHYYNFNTPMSDVSFDAAASTIFLTLVKVQSKNLSYKRIFAPFGDSSDLFDIIGFAVNFSTVVSDVRKMDSNELATIGEIISSAGGYDAIFGEGAVTEITKDEFYKIPPVLTIQIYDGIKSYLYEEGMTWGEWVNSEYSKGEFKLKDCGDYQEIRHIASYGDIAECFDTGCYNVKDSDLIYNKPYECLTPPA